MIAAQCRKCGAQFEAEEALAGRNAECPKCKAAVEVGPAPALAPAPVSITLRDDRAPRGSIFSGGRLTDTIARALYVFGAILILLGLVAFARMLFVPLNVPVAPPGASAGSRGSGPILWARRLSAPSDRRRRPSLPRRTAATTRSFIATRILSRR